MADRSNDDDAMRALLAEPRRIAMVGASPKPERDSYRVFSVLRRHGHDVLPINPVAADVQGVPCVPDLQAAAKHWGAPPEIVDVFRAPEHVPEVLDAALDIQAPWLWLQLGVVDEASRDRAVAAGMEVVMDRCIKVELLRLV